MDSVKFHLDSVKFHIDSVTFHIDSVKFHKATGQRQCLRAPYLFGKQRIATVELTTLTTPRSAVDVTSPALPTLPKAINKT